MACGCWEPNSDIPEEQEVCLTLEPCLRPPPSPHVLFWGSRDNRIHLSGVIESLQELTWLRPAAQMEGAHLPTGPAWGAFDGSESAHQGGISISLANGQCTVTSVPISPARYSRVGASTVLVSEPGVDAPGSSSGSRH